jgi:hypothetical protein
MGIGSKKIPALWVIASILSVLLGSAPETQAAPAAEPPPAAAATVEPQPEPVAAPEAKPAPAPEAAPAKPRTLRRLRGGEMTVPLASKAREIINEHYKKPFGTDIDFELDGKHYVGRIERHYHPPGGDKHPWGPHAGCSLFIVVP